MKVNAKIKNLIDSFQRNKNKKTKTLLLIAVLACILAFALLIGGVVSWFISQNNAAERNVKVTDFDATVGISVDGGSNYSDLDGTMVTKSNFSNLRLRITYTGESDAYIRVKLFESFCDKNGNILQASDTVYSVGSAWVYNEDDGYYYCKNVAEGAAKDDPLIIPFVTGGVEVPVEAVTYADDSGFKLAAIVEQVQPDRFEDFFEQEISVIE